MQTQTNDITTYIIIITCIFFVTALFMIFYVLLFLERKKRFVDEKKIMQQQFQQQLLKSQIETQEETITALGRELHDNVGQLLNSTKMLIGVTQRTITNTPETLTIADETLGKAIHELRGLSKSLSKEWLQQFNLIDNLKNEVNRINAANQIHVNLQVLHVITIASNKQIILFRIIQEALQNAIKHAQAKVIDIKFHQANHVFFINIVDDGIGMPISNAPSNGIGLINMQQRTNLLGGTIQWHADQNGTAVNIQLPIKSLEND